jgi:hypothetical protein
MRWRRSCERKTGEATNPVAFYRPKVAPKLWLSAGQYVRATTVDKAARVSGGRVHLLSNYYGMILSSW